MRDDALRRPAVGEPSGLLLEALNGICNVTYR